MATDVKMRKYKLNVFSVVMNESSTNFPLANRVFGALKKAGKAKERLIYLNKGESGDVDLVAKFQLSEDFLFGTFVRLNNTRDSILKLSDLENDEVEIEKIIALARDDSAGTVKSISYFGLYGHTLVLENAKNTLKALKVYISSFLDRSGEPDIQLEFVQKVKSVEGVTPNDIRSIRIGEDAFLNPKFSGSSSFSTHLKELTGGMVRQLLGCLIKDEDIDRLVKATLVLKFNKQELKKEEALQVAMSLVDDENVVITGKNGRTIKGTDMKVVEERDIELTSEGLPNEFMLCEEMKSIAKLYNG